VLSIQLAYYKWATGNFWVYSYGNEHFNFLHPQFFDFLFSYRKGLFVYAPILLLATIGFTVLYKQSPFQMMSLFAFMILIVFVLSSWWMWYYGGGFGMRPMIDYFVFFAFLLSLLIQRIMNSQKGGYVAMLMLMILCVAAQIQTYQKVNFIMPWDGMNKEIYWKIFLKTDKSYIGKYKA
jgi:general stress protein CsbA